MPNRNLTSDELELARELLKSIRERIDVLANGDGDLRFAYRRKIAKELTYDERSGPMVRRKLKTQKRKEQLGLCARCHEPLPEKYAVLDRLVAAKGYNTGNTRLICEKCDREVQTERRYT
jgi:5-methylcytosine-specific restriction endonuclease McrA